MTDREAFEKRMAAKYDGSSNARIQNILSRHGDGYESMATQLAWEDWQAATAAERERCAKVREEGPQPRSIKMENQHRQIKGYRELSQDEIDLMNEGEALAEQCGAFVEKLQKAEFAKTSGQDTDKRWVAIGRTHLQEGFMALIRSIAKPTTF